VPVVVVVPAHDSSDTIGQTLSSVAMQSVQPQEVVVCDDASTDDTVEVVTRWREQLPLTLLTSETSGGPAVARHRAIEASNSPLIAFLDADDVWFPDHLESLVALHRSLGGIALARFLRWAPGEALGSAPSDIAALPSPDRQLERLYFGNYIWIATVFERTLYDEAGGFRLSLRGPEDWDLYIRMVRCGARVHRAGHVTVLYRMRRGSLMWDDRTIDDRIRVLEFARQEANDGVEQAAIAKALRELHAERALLTAYGHAREGRPGQARAAARRALGGQRRVALRAAAMLVAPTATEARRHLLRNRPALRVNR
jgi:glycosyltransferase involved in cell wall biosynthesis